MPTVVIHAIKSKFVVHVKEWNVKHPAELHQFDSAQFVNPLNIINMNGFSSELMVSIGGIAVFNSFSVHILTYLHKCTETKHTFCLLNLW